MKTSFVVGDIVIFLLGIILLITLIYSIKCVADSNFESGYLKACNDFYNGSLNAEFVTKIQLKK